jgi:hypothetical protein
MVCPFLHSSNHYSITNPSLAQKAKEAPKKPGGWGLGGWFGGAKKESTDMSAQPNKPIRAKLGEASSFVYDPDLKRWVNKKAGAEQTEAKSATPPPPKAGPPRTISGPPGGAGPTSAPATLRGPPPPGLGQRAVSESGMRPPPSATSLDGESKPPGSGLVPPNMSRSASNGSLMAGSGPPSRPGTSMSNASSIDDLLGPPSASVRKAGGPKGKKKGRGYVDVMGEKGT